MQNQQRDQRRTITIDRGKKPGFKPREPKGWSHQKFLEANKGKKIRVVYNLEEEVEGTLIEADQFTLLVTGVSTADPASTKPVERLVFKSAIVELSFSV